MQDRKSMAKYAIIGAIIAIPVPVVGPIIGAAAGAGLAYYKNKQRGDALRTGSSIR